MRGCAAQAADGEEAPELKYGKIANPTVHAALNQTSTVVNALIRPWGKPQQIALELGRELKGSCEAKGQMNAIQAANTRHNEMLNKTIRQMYVKNYPNRDDRIRFRFGRSFQRMRCRAGVFTAAR